MGWLNGKDTPDSSMDARVRQLELQVAELRHQLHALQAGSAAAGSVAASPQTVPSGAVQSPSAWEAEARALKAAGKSIQAIKHVRDATGWGLAQAKTFVDRL